MNERAIIHIPSLGGYVTTSKLTPNNLTKDPQLAYYFDLEEAFTLAGQDTSMFYIQAIPVDTPEYDRHVSLHKQRMRTPPKKRGRKVGSHPRRKDKKAT